MFDHLLEGKLHIDSAWQPPKKIDVSKTEA